MKSSYDRSEIMRAAWCEWKRAKAKGWHLGDDPWTFAACLRLAHAAARKRKLEVAQYHAPATRARRDTPFPYHAAAHNARDIIRL